MKYLAEVRLQRRLAPLPESVELVKHAIRGVMGGQKCDLSRLSGEPIHHKFVNWRSGPEDIIEFTKRYGVLDWDGELVGQKQICGTEFAFLDFEWQQRQNEIRELWGTDRKPLEWAMLPLAGHFPIAKEADRISRRFAAYDPKLDEDILQGPGTVWESGSQGPTASVETLTTWQYIGLLMIFEKVRSLRKCENPDCAAPYFIARRKDQVFCGQDCAHLIAVNRWWSRHGNEWRRARAARKKPNKKS